MPRLDPLDGRYAVARLAADAPEPGWVRGDIVSVTRTRDELSIACAESAVPDDVQAERGFRCLRVEGPIDFSATGILDSLLQPLAYAGISIFAVSTYDTDYIFVPDGDLDRALGALRAAGHSTGE